MTQQNEPTKCPTCVQTEQHYIDMFEGLQQARSDVDMLINCLHLFYQHLDIFGIVPRKFETDSQLIEEAKSQDACFEAYHKCFKQEV